MLVLQCMYDDFKKTWSVKLLGCSYKVYLGELKQRYSRGRKVKCTFWEMTQDWRKEKKLLVKVGTINLHLWHICITKYESDCFTIFPCPISILLVNTGPFFLPSPHLSRNRDPRTLLSSGSRPEPPEHAWTTGNFLSQTGKTGPRERAQRRENVIRNTDLIYGIEGPQSRQEKEDLWLEISNWKNS